MTVADTRPKTALTTEAEIPVVVADRRQVAAGVVQLRLAPAGGALPPWNPGAHIDLLLPNGLVRQYSLCGEADETEWTIMVLRERHGRGGSAHVHDELRAGQQLVARGPRNHFALEQAPRYRFIAGGIGITRSCRCCGPSKRPVRTGRWPTAGAHEKVWPKWTS